MKEHTHHELKAFLDNYQAIASGKKRSDIRRNDRNFKPGDTITYNEGCMQNGEFIETGRRVNAEVTYIDTFGLLDPDHDVNLSIRIF